MRLSRIQMPTIIICGGVRLAIYANGLMTVEGRNPNLNSKWGW